MGDTVCGEDTLNMSWHEREAKRFEDLLAERWNKDGTRKIQLMGKAKDSLDTYTGQIEVSKFVSVKVAESELANIIRAANDVTESVESVKHLVEAYSIIIGAETQEKMTIWTMGDNFEDDDLDDALVG